MIETFFIAKEKLKNLWVEKQRQRLLEQVEKFKGVFSLQKMADQMKNESGAFNEAFSKKTSEFSNKTGNVEIIMSFDLSDLYFPSIDTEIGF